MSKHGKWVLHGMSHINPNVCRGNAGRGPRIIETLHPSMVRMFGQNTADAIRTEIYAGRDAYFMPPREIHESFVREAELAARKTYPEPIP